MAYVCGGGFGRRRVAAVVVASPSQLAQVYQSDFDWYHSHDVIGFAGIHTMNATGWVRRYTHTHTRIRTHTHAHTLSRV